MSLLSAPTGWWLARSYSSVLLYHSTFARPPGAIARNLHNVTPDQLYRQLEWIARHFTVLDIDEYFAAGRPAGTAAITFDDGYACVLAEALPVLEALSLPATLFVNGCTLSGQVFWRDKVRHLINAGLVAAFVAQIEPGHPLHAIAPADFYRRSKQPPVNSAELDARLDTFLAGAAAVPVANYCIDAATALPAHALLSFGNHTFHHYVVATLDRDQQAWEIEANERLLDRLGGRRSRVFSTPFGGAGDYDATTLALCAEMGFAGVLLSGNRMNRAQPRGAALPLAERHMAPATDAGLRRQMALLALQGRALSGAA